MPWFSRTIPQSLWNRNRKDNQMLIGNERYQLRKNSPNIPANQERNLGRKLPYSISTCECSIPFNIFYDTHKYLLYSQRISSQVDFVLTTSIVVALPRNPSILNMKVWEVWETIALEFASQFFLQRVMKWNPSPTSSDGFMCAGFPIYIASNGHHQIKTDSGNTLLFPNEIR